MPLPPHPPGYPAIGTYDVMFPSLGRLAHVEGNANEPGVLADAAAKRHYR